MNPLVFTAKLKETPVEIDGASYTLKELSGAQRDAYLDTVGERMRYDEKGNPKGIKTFKGMQAELICRSLTDSNGVLVKKEVVSTWPASVQDGLFKAAQNLSELGNEAVDEAKND